MLLVVSMSGACGTDGGDYWDGACRDSGPLGLMGCVSKERYESDVEAVATSRPSGSPQWQQAQDYCADTLRELGLDVSLDSYGTGVNVLGRKPGTLTDEVVLIGAHYDSVQDCSGADDNATGVAGVLELARVFSTIELERTLVFACWDEEERGLIGSSTFANRLVTDDPPPTLVINFDMIGVKSDEPGSQQVPPGFELFFLLYQDQLDRFESNERRADFIFWVANAAAMQATSRVQEYADIIGLPVLGGVLPDGLDQNEALSDLRRSDHAPFWQHDLPAVFFTDTANLRYGGYHCADGDDSLDRIDFGFAAAVVTATAGLVSTLALDTSNEDLATP